MIIIRWRNAAPVGRALAVLIGTVTSLLAGCKGAPQDSGDDPRLQAGEAVQLTADSLAPAVGFLADWTRAPNGDLYLADASANAIYVKRPGVAWDSVGRSGEGPGEFRGIGGLAIDGSGRLWVDDAAKRVLSVFSASGALDTTITWPSLTVDPPQVPMFDRDGTLMGLVFVRESRTRFRRAVLRARPPTWQPTLEMLPPVEVETYEIHRPDGRLAMVAGVPYSSAELWAGTPDGDVWMATSAEYLIRRVTEEGDTVATIRRDVVPEPVTVAERDSALRASVGPKWDSMPDVDPERVPATKPPIARLVASGAGRLFVERPADRGSRFDVFEADGRYLGTFDLPTRFATRYRVLASDSAITGIVEDADGVPQVVTFPLTL